MLNTILIQFEERFGVKVDVRIPQAIKDKLYSQWERWTGGIKDYTTLDTCNLLTRYEHFTIGSGVGLPPDPFKPLALQHDGANLVSVINARKQTHPPGVEYSHPFYPSLVEDFEQVTGLDKYKHCLAAQYPEINDKGRVKIPRIVAVYNHNKNKIDFGDDIIAKLQLPTWRNSIFDGVSFREVFDFDNGYRLELVALPEGKK